MPLKLKTFTLLILPCLKEIMFYSLNKKEKRKKGSSSPLLPPFSHTKVSHSFLGLHIHQKSKIQGHIFHRGPTITQAQFGLHIIQWLAHVKL
jgi:hypothetical protein